MAYLKERPREPLVLDDVDARATVAAMTDAEAQQAWSAQQGARGPLTPLERAMRPWLARRVLRAVDPQSGGMM